MDDGTEEQKIVLNALVEPPIEDASDHHDQSIAKQDGELLPLQFP